MFWDVGCMWTASTASGLRWRLASVLARGSKSGRGRVDMADRRAGWCVCVCMCVGVFLLVMCLGATEARILHEFFF